MEVLFAILATLVVSILFFRTLQGQKSISGKSHSSEASLSPPSPLKDLYPKEEKVILEKGLIEETPDEEDEEEEVFPDADWGLFRSPATIDILRGIQRTMTEVLQVLQAQHRTIQHQDQQLVRIATAIEKNLHSSIQTPKQGIQFIDPELIRVLSKLEKTVKGLDSISTDKSLGKDLVVEAIVGFDLVKVIDIIVVENPANHEKMLQELVAKGWQPIAATEIDNPETGIAEVRYILGARSEYLGES